jgi:signal peptidase II
VLRELRTVWVRPLLVATTIVVLDQLAKAYIWNLFGPTPIEGSSVPLVGDWLRLTLVKNTGVAFGMFQNFPQFFTVTSILISLGAIYYYRFYLPNRSWVVQLCLGLIVGGAIGNIIDRIRHGYVLDFIHVTWFPGIFNIADSAITVGTLLLAAYILFHSERAEPPPAPRDERLLGDLLSGDRWSQSGDGKQ